MTEVFAALESVQRGTVAAASAAAPNPSVTASDDSRFNEFLAGLAHTEMNPRGTKL